MPGHHMAGRQKCWKINTVTIELAEKTLHNMHLCVFDRNRQTRKKHKI
jgi:hypothetical protein